MKEEVSREYIFNFYLNGDDFSSENVDEDELYKASVRIHQYFNDKVSISLSKGFLLRFEPIGQESAFLVGDVLSKNAMDLQKYLNMLRFRKIRLVHHGKRKELANGINEYLNNIFIEHDIDGMSTYNPNFITDSLNGIKNRVVKYYEKIMDNDYTFTIGGMKNSKKEKRIIYQVLVEVMNILRILFSED